MAGLLLVFLVLCSQEERVSHFIAIAYCEETLSFTLFFLFVFVFMGSTSSVACGKMEKVTSEGNYGMSQLDCTGVQ